MQIDSIATNFAIAATTSTLAATTKVTQNGSTQNAVVEHTSSGYQGYVPAPPGPIVTGSSIEDVEFQLSSGLSLHA